MTIQEAVDNIVFSYDKSNDFAFKQKIERDVLVARSEIIKRENNKPGAYPRSLITSLKRIPTETVKISGLEFKVVKSKYKIPKPISTKEQETGFIYIGSNRGTSFTFCKLENFRFRYSKFKVPVTCYDYEDEYIYILDDDCKEFTVDAIFQDSKQLELINDIEDKSAFQGFTIGEDIFTGIMKLVFEMNPLLIPRKDIDLENEQSTRSTQ